MSLGEQRFLGELLARRGVVAADKLEPLFVIQREKGGDLVDLLVGASLADEISIARALADEAQVPLVEHVEPAAISAALATRVPIAFAKVHKLLVIGEDE